MMFNIFGKNSKRANFIYFQTADGCCRMVPTTPGWAPLPSINIPLDFPLPVKDWMNKELTDDDMFAPPTSFRTFRLESEDFLPDGKTLIFSYREIR